MAPKGKGNTVSVVWALVKPFADELGLVLWDIRFVKEGASWYLRVFIDKEGGVSIDDCVDLSHAINKPLDDADPIDGSYCLEVCSPGIERELTRDFHFEQKTGEPVKVRLIRPDENKQKEFSGVLKSFADGLITLETDSGEKVFDKKETAWVKLDDFEA